MSRRRLAVRILAAAGCALALVVGYVVVASVRFNRTHPRFGSYDEMMERLAATQNRGEFGIVVNAEGVLGEGVCRTYHVVTWAGDRRVWTDCIGPEACNPGHGIVIYRDSGALGSQTLGSECVYPTQTQFPFPSSMVAAWEASLAGGASRSGRP